MSNLFSLSEASSIAIHSMALIANTEKQLNVKTMAEMTGFSRNHMAKVLQTLVRYNFLSSTRGPAGGFKLIKEPKEISLLEIYETIEGKLTNEPCIKKVDCPFENCVFGGITSKLTEEFKVFFSNRMLSDLLLKKDETN
ncbi:MAG: Rrf2 family transcriptional regulator [Saprospiraceae bacterium]|nr:Rrf2 family transcriptional regulator [Saprospiraceae bacterium]